ncbi:MULTISPECIES: helix-turn-helix domain-containing protein [Pseudomonas]|uniref:helix-turn-helix domain-containing protein n=1 Tax=Pseudomonas TaxID=286 RepID=UPI000A76C2E0|nr:MULTISPECIES: helix-turn-helix domain-containing protein [Pseudomonas]
MSVQAMTWALEQRVVTDSSARHVLLCLANYADKHGRGAFPSVASLADDTGLSERTVQAKLRLLEDLGVIVEGNRAIAAAYITRRDRVPTCYDIVMERGEPAAPRQNERGETTAPRADATGCNLQQNGVQITTERGAAAAPNPSLNHQGTEEQLQHASDPVDVRQRFAMTEDWEPDPDDLAAQTRLMGIPVSAITLPVVNKFKAHWLALPDVVFSQAKWANELAKWIKRERVEAGGGESDGAAWGANGVRV